MKKILTLTLILFALVANAQTPEYYMSKKGYKKAVLQKNYGMVDNVLKSYMFQYNAGAGVYELTNDQWVYQIHVKIKKNSKVVMIFYATPDGFDSKYAIKNSRQPIFEAFWDQVNYGLENGMIRPTESDALHAWSRKHYKPIN